MTFITEDWLRDNFTLSEGSEIHLPADSRMTPSADRKPPFTGEISG